jgi:hypothetical protein
MMDVYFISCNWTRETLPSYSSGKSASNIWDENAHPDENAFSQNENSFIQMKTFHPSTIYMCKIAVLIKMQRNLV